MGGADEGRGVRLDDTPMRLIFPIGDRVRDVGQQSVIFIMIHCFQLAKHATSVSLNIASLVIIINMTR